MIKIQHYLTGLDTMSLVMAPGCQSEDREIKPNIVFILADDLGYGDLSCLNPDSRIKTDFMDQIAREGMIFTSAHSPSGQLYHMKTDITESKNMFLEKPDIVVDLRKQLNDIKTQSRTH